MSDKPEALLLAGQLESGEPVTGSAAAELRRLHAVNQELLEALQKIAGNTYDEWTNGAEAARIARAALPRQLLHNTTLHRATKAQGVTHEAQPCHT